MQQFSIQSLDLTQDPLRKIFSSIQRPPKQIFVQGSTQAYSLLESLPERGFAIVGTRAPQKRCLEMTAKIVSGLRGSGLVILSGLARGIDQKAHEEALRANLPTIAVLGCGIDQTYPPENDILRRKILESGGLIISEWGPNTVALPAFFIQRNRLIAGLAQATWVVQAGYRSGASNTANWANEMGKKVYTTPGFPGDPSLAGNQKLILSKDATPLWGIDELTQTWFDLIHHLDGHQSTAHLMLSIEKKLNEGLTLPEAIVECSHLLNVPIERVIEEYEKNG